MVYMYMGVYFFTRRPSARRRRGRWVGEFDQDVRVWCVQMRVMAVNRVHHSTQVRGDDSVQSTSRRNASTSAHAT